YDPQRGSAASWILVQSVCGLRKRPQLFVSCAGVWTCSDSSGQVKLRRRFEMRMRRSGWRGAAPLAACGLAWLLAARGVAHAENPMGGDVFAPGQADFTQSGSKVGRGPGFQFSDAFYAANGVNAQDIRSQERGATAPSRFGAFYRGPGDAFVASGTAP